MSIRGFFGKIHHFLFRTETEIHILEKKRTFQIIQNPDKSYEKIEKIPKFMLEGAEHYKEEFPIARMLAKGGGASGGTFNFSRDLVEKNGIEAFGSVHVVMTENRTPTIVLLGTTKNGKEVNTQSGDTN